MVQTISASQFKARCLGLMDQVAATGVVRLISKNGRPGAELHPCREPRHPIPFAIHASVAILGDLLAPIDAMRAVLASFCSPAMRSGWIETTQLLDPTAWG